MKTILVIRSSAMGDVAMTVPVIESLLETYSDVQIVMLTRGFYAPFFSVNDRLTIVNADLHGVHKGFAGIFRLSKELKSKFKIDTVVDLHGKIYSHLLCAFFKLSGIKTFQIDKGRAEKRRLTRRKNKVMVQLRPTVLRYADVLARAGLPIIEEELQFGLDGEQLGFGGCAQSRIATIPPEFLPKDETWIGIAPFAQHRGKRLDINTIEKLIELISIQYPSARVLIFGGGKTEADVAIEFENRFANCTSAIGKVKLPQEIALIANLDVMVSMDSSSMHIASLVGVRTVSIWGATHHLAGFLGVGQSVADVVQVDSLECRPCSVYGNKPCYRGDYACLSQITPEQIMHKVSVIINDNHSHTTEVG